MKKYAWIPTIAWTWREVYISKAAIWLQSYNIDKEGKKTVCHLGLFSYEFRGRLFPFMNWFR